MTAFDDLLADPEADRVYLVFATPKDPATGDPVPLHLATRPFRTGPGDVPANTIFSPRVANALVFTQSVAADGRIRGEAAIDPGSIDLTIGDSRQPGAVSTFGDMQGRLDWILDLVWGNAPVEVRLGGPGFAIADFGVIFTGLAETAGRDGELVSIAIQDGLRRLRVPVQANEFAGTGGTEGGADLKGVKKPLLLGPCFNVEPVYLGIVSGKEEYQVNDGQADDVAAVRSNGGALDEAVGAPIDGEFLATLSAGRFTLGGSGLGTVITADVLGDAAGGVYVEDAAGLVERVLKTRLDPPYADADFAPGTLAALATAVSAPIGVYLRDPGETAVLELIRRILDSVGAVPLADTMGRLEIVRIVPPAGAPVATFTASEILEIERVPIAIPASRVRLGWGRCWRVQGSDQLASGTDEAVRTFVARDLRYEPAETATVNPLAAEESFESDLAYVDDATVEAARRAALYGQDWGGWRIRVKTQPFARRIGQEIRFYDDEHAPDGRDVVILELTRDAGASEATMIVIGGGVMES